MNTYEVVVVASGSGRRKLHVPIVDGNGAPIDITGSTLRLQGVSADLPAKTIDVAGAIYGAPANGIAEWTTLNTLITLTDLGAKPSATFTMEVKYTDASGTDYTSQFGLKFRRSLV